MRVVSGARGALKSEGLEAPFVGRDRELRQIKDSSTSAPRAEGAPGLGDRHRRDREVAAGVGVLQVFRRPAADRVLASRPLPLLRRGRHLLGARGHGADACRIAEDEAPARPRRSSARCWSTTSATRTSWPSSSRASATCSGWRRAPASNARTCSRPGGSSSSGWPTLPDGAGVRGHAVGGCVADGFHRVPARMVAQQPPVPDHARPPRADRTAADLGRRQAQLHLALPRAAAGVDDARSADRTGAGPAGVAA